MSISNVTYSIFAAFSADRSRLVKGVEAWRFQRVHAPYALMPITDDPCLLLPVNRQYSPLGVDNENYVGYEPYVSQAIHFRHDLFWEVGIWHPEIRYLFGFTPAERDYVKRLNKLASLAVDPSKARVLLGLKVGGAQ